MKINILLILLFISSLGFTQQKTIQGSGIIKRFDENGKLMQETEYANINIKNSPIKRWTKEGSSKTYHDNGNLKIVELYKNNKYDGELTTYYKNKQLKRKDIFSKDKFISGVCYAQDGSEIEHFDYFIHPEYEGGTKAIYKFVARNLRYPDMMKELGIQGRVIVRFTVTKDAELENIRISKSPHSALSKEAIRVVKLLKNWKPGKIDGEKTDIAFALPISFKLN